MSLPIVLDHLAEFIWGRQFRLVGCRALLLEPVAPVRLTEGPADADRRFAAYRCRDGQFRCLTISCLIPMNDAVFYVIPGSHKANLPLPFEASCLDSIEPLVEMTVPRGAVVLFTESLSRAIKPPDSETDGWLLYQYGTSYMVNWPGCDPSSELRDRTADDPDKRHLILEPYYHPAGAYRRKSTEE